MGSSLDLHWPKGLNLDSQKAKQKANPRRKDLKKEIHSDLEMDSNLGSRSHLGSGLGLPMETRLDWQMAKRKLKG